MNRNHWESMFLKFPGDSDKAADLMTISGRN